MENKKWDVQLPPPTIRILPTDYFSAGQVEDWGHKYLKASLFYPTTRGKGSTIFVLDTAGTTDHPDLVDRFRPEYSKNFTNSPTLDDRFGHGTHCAGIALATDNGQGVIGIAPEADLGLVKVLNDQASGDWRWIAAGIRYVADLEIPGIKVISLSLGGRSGNQDLRNAIGYAIGKGCRIVSAAGNEGYKEGENSINFPGRYEEVITVGSFNKLGQISRFSSGGPELDLVAPGELILSTHLNGGYVEMSGTSMATPQIAGLVGLLSIIRPDLDQYSIEKYLEDNATDLLTPGKDDQSGSGIPIADDLIDPEPPDPDPDPDPDPPRGCLSKIFNL